MGEGTADTLYPDAGRELGEEYHFRHVGKVYSQSVRRHLRKKGVAVALVLATTLPLWPIGQKTTAIWFWILPFTRNGPLRFMETGFQLPC